jgi:hypothetical protein
MIMDDLESSYRTGAITLHEAIALMMGSNEPCPDWLRKEYELALMDYQSGGDFMQTMGLNYYTKGHGTPVKRIADEKNHQIAANLRYILEDLVSFGLYKNTPLKHKAENKMSKEVLDKVKLYLKMYKVIVTEKIDRDLELMTAYEVASLIFSGASESKIREIEAKYIL